MHIEIKRNKVQVNAMNRITGKRMNQKWVREVTRKEIDKMGFTNYELWLQAEKSWGYIYSIEKAPQLAVEI